jgi:Peptidase A4 family
MAFNLPNGVEVTTYDGPPRGFDSLNADSADLQKFGLPPRQDDPELQAKYDRFLNRVQGKFNYIPATFRTNSEVFHGPRQRVTSAATETSANWSGAVVFAPAGTSYQWILGEWVVPDVDAPTENQWYYCASWVGIDGDGSGDVCQAGIGSQVYRSGTAVTRDFYVWWEWYPLPEVQITSLPIGPGDMVTALLCARPGAGATTATVYLSNVTTGASTSVTFNAPAGTSLSGNCAEWVVEAPTVNGQQSLMADFGEVFFSVCDAETTTPSTVYGGTGDNINLINSAGTVIVDGNLITSTVVQCAYVGTRP